jgi:two-component system OmpR family response regulator
MVVQGLKALLVEDSSVLAERLADVIGEIQEFDLVGVVDSEAAALAEIKKRRLDVVLLDLHLKEGTGFGILRALAAMHVKPYVVVLTNHDSVEYERQAIALGAQCFLDKARDFHRLPQVLRDIVGATPTQS